MLGSESVLPDASQITDGTGGGGGGSGERPTPLVLLRDGGGGGGGGGGVLRIPTVHVHGLRDQGLGLHRELYDEFCAPEGKRLVEWDGDHRVPLKFHDVSLVARQIRELARLTEV